MKHAIAAALLLSFAHQTYAQNVGRWVGITSPEQMATGVASQSGALLGMTCTKATNLCAWGLSLDLECRPGMSYPLLMGSSAGGAHVIGVCEGKSSDPRLYRYNISTDMSTVFDAILGGGTVGFVIQSKSGTFSVYRFEVDEARTAVNGLMDTFQRWQRSTRGDSTL